MFRRQNQSTGQALVEFALILTVLLMLIFLIIESARILQGWVTVQNAARVGARYAITGQNETTCPTQTLPKFVSKCTDLRLASIISATHDSLAGLPLNESAASNAYRDINGNPPDDQSYDIQVWGAMVTDSGSVLMPDFGGQPGQPVVVRAIYNVPIITPFFNAIITVVPVFGQVTMNNEGFGSLGNEVQGLGLPPQLPPLPTVGATSTPTPIPTNTPPPTAGPTSTATVIPSDTPPPTPTYCGAVFEGSVVHGWTSAFVSGEVGATVTIVDLTTGQTLGTDTFIAVSGHTCPGFADFNSPVFTTPLVNGHVLLALPNLGQPATTIVLPGTPTPTATATQIVLPTNTPTSTPTSTPTGTPTNPYLLLIANCSIGSNAQFNVLGFNFNNTQAISLSWVDPNGTAVPQSIIPAGHGGSFTQSWTRNGLQVGTSANPVVYQVRAQTNTVTVNAPFSVPCANVPPPPITPTPSPTPRPADLIVVGPPRLVSTPPLIAYRPIDISLTISNTGDIDISSLFYVDIFFDPTGTLTPTIGISQTVGYMGVSTLPGNSSRVITITAPIGFANIPNPHMVYGFVDSLDDASELNETNNVSTPLPVGNVTPAATPTATATPASGTLEISGVVRVRLVNWLPLNRAPVVLVNQSNGQVVATTLSDSTGYYEFTQVPAGTYTVKSCVQVDNSYYFGLRIGVVPSDPYADVFLMQGPCS